jgi:hypothetical protein
LVFAKKGMVFSRVGTRKVFYVKSFHKVSAETSCSNMANVGKIPVFENEKMQPNY